MPNKINRRKVLSTLGAGSIGLGYLPAVTGAAENLIELPKFVHGDTVLETHKVEKEWYEHTQRVRKVKSDFTQRWGNRKGVIGISLVRSPITYGGRNGLQLQVEIDRNKGIPDIPASHQEIPVRITDSTGKERVPATRGAYEGSCPNPNSGYYISGGNHLYCPDVALSGTSAATVNMGGNQYMMSCAHIFWNGCGDSESEIEGRSVEWDGVNIGVVDGVIKDADVAWVSLNSNVDWDYYIDDHRNNHASHLVRGSVTKSTLDRWLSRSASNRPDLVNSGMTTGMTVDKLAALNYDETIQNSSCVDYADGHGVYTWIDFANGDSGGPTFYQDPDDDQVYVVSVTSYYYWPEGDVCGNEWGSESCGTGAYRLRDYGFSFGQGYGA